MPENIKRNLQCFDRNCDKSLSQWYRNMWMRVKQREWFRCDSLGSSVRGVLRYSGEISAGYCLLAAIDNAIRCFWTQKTYHTVGWPPKLPCPPSIDSSKQPSNYSRSIDSFFYNLRGDFSPQAAHCILRMQSPYAFHPQLFVNFGTIAASCGHPFVSCLKKRKAIVTNSPLRIVYLCSSKLLYSYYSSHNGASKQIKQYS